MHDSNNYVSHYEYIKIIALAWIDQEEYWPEPKKQKRHLSEVPDEELIIKEARQTRARRGGRTSPMSETSEEGTQKRTRLLRATPTKGPKRHNASVTDISLHPSKGSLMCRLATNCQHIPVKSRSNRPRCQLHRWARGRDGVAVMNQIIGCSICCVDLCVPCFGVFHKEANLIDMKDTIAAIEK